MTFDKTCPALLQTSLWQHLKNIADDDSFRAALQDLCCQGVVLSKDVIRFFPTFTLHDETHIRGVCEWMAKLLGDRINELDARDAALLLLAACWHDSGMAVSEEQKKSYVQELGASEFPTHWKKHFQKHPKDELDFRKNGLSDAMLRNFVRDNHHNRVAEQLPEVWPTDISKAPYYIRREDLVLLCQSHGQELNTKAIGDYDGPLNLRLCAVLLRLADALDYDATRTPDRLFKHLGLDNPETPEQKRSQEAWEHTGAGSFSIVDHCLIYASHFTDPQVEHYVRSYLNWLNDELSTCRNYLSRYSGKLNNLALPFEIKENVERDGYEAGDFCLTMDQDRVLELLAGENLYPSPGVFVRELLQNAIDAVLMRREVDPSFGKDAGKIVIRSWIDEEGESWFRIEDDGIGMDEHILKDYFLKIGRSYYASDEFRARMLHAGEQTGFQPISRFGIGILSCFMSDPDDTVLELATRRFNDGNGDNPLFRMDVTGLRGYYFLTKPVRGKEGRALHHPPKVETERDDYRHGIGTTVCVRPRLHRMGEYRSFKELMDQFICFPEVKIEYYGPEGYAEYKTQHELMDAVHEINGNSLEKRIKEYVHPLPEKLLEELKAKTPFIAWRDTDEVSLVFKYYPVDWYSDAEDIQGAVVNCDLLVSGACKPVIYNTGDSSGICYPGLLTKCVIDPLSHSDSAYLTIGIAFETARVATSPTIFFADEGMIVCAPISTLSTMGCEPEPLPTFGEISFPIAQFTSSFSAEEHSLLDTLFHGSRTAYNGVLVENKTSDGFTRFHFNSALLLSGASRPNVSLSRDSIVDIPLETACALTLMEDSEVSVLHYNLLLSENYTLRPAFEYEKLLQKHVNWTDKASIGGQNGRKYYLTAIKHEILNNGSVEILFNERGTLSDMLCWAAIGHDFGLHYDFNSCPDYFVATKDQQKGLDLNSFPVAFFAQAIECTSTVGVLLMNRRHIPYHFGSNGSIYNVSHPFSRWLIDNQADLREQEPEVYNQIISIMALGRDSSKIQEDINRILKFLLDRPGNPFNLHNGLFLKDGDIIEK